MSPPLATLVQQLYSPAVRGIFDFEAFVGHERVRYFRLGRHALLEALRLSGVKPGNAVLLPRFICRELLASLHHAGAVPVFYDVTLPDLAPIPFPAAAQRAKAVLAVNYFGLPQDLAPFRRLCNETGARLIEDNAHGLFSRDASGAPLGSRGDLGIFSFRKTLDLPHGAALVVNEPSLAPRLEPQLPCTQDSAARRGKSVVRHSARVLGPSPAYFAIRAMRAMRRWRTGSEIPLSDDASEFVIPGEAAPAPDLMERLSQAHVESESTRRRELHMALASELKGLGIGGLTSLPDQVVPAGFAFVATAAQLQAARATLQHLNLDCYPWPQLPSSAGADMPEWYRNVLLVNFVW